MFGEKWANQKPRVLEIEDGRFLVEFGKLLRKRKVGAKGVLHVDAALAGMTVSVEKTPTGCYGLSPVPRPGAVNAKGILGLKACVLRKIDARGRTVICPSLAGKDVVITRYPNGMYKIEVDDFVL